MKVRHLHQDFVVFENFLEDPETIFENVKALNAAGQLQLDNVNVKGGVYLYNPPPFLKLMIRQHLRLRESGFLKDLIPTYCFLRQYLPGSNLPPHVDRDECEMNLSYIIEGNETFSLRDSEGIVHHVELKKNEAILYSGKHREHWRDRIDGYLCVALFHFGKDQG